MVPQSVPQTFNRQDVLDEFADDLQNCTWTDARNRAEQLLWPYFDEIDRLRHNLKERVDP